MKRIKLWEKKCAVNPPKTNVTGGVASDFRSDENGSLVIFGLFIFLLMLMIGGMAVDLMRYETNRARLQSTLDRAVLAAASLDQPLTAVEVVTDYFEKAGMADYLQPSDVTVENTLTARRVTIDTSMQVNSTFMRLLGINHLVAPAYGTAEESASRTEVSLVVDVSGSMNWTSSTGRSKMTELREAATTFVNIIMCNPEDPDDTDHCTVTEDTVSVTLVPYSHQVLAGESVLAEMNVTSEHANSSCIDFESADYLSASMSPTTSFNRAGYFDAWYTWGNPRLWSCPAESWREVLPYENDPEDVRDAISDLQVWGATSVDVGMKWGVAFLDPAFQPVIQGLVDSGVVDDAFDDRPYSYTENGIKKVVVLMTDGENTSQPYLLPGYRSGPSGIWRRSWNNTYFTYPVSGSVQLSFPELWELKPARWYANQGMGWAYSWHGNSAKDTRLDQICTAAKAQNITVFTIGFEVSSHSATVMESCASSPAHFFDVDGADLTDAFASIARSIAALRLVN